MIIVDDVTNNNLHNQSTNQFRFLNTVCDLQQSSKSLLGVVDSLDLSKPPIVDPIDSLIVGFRQIEDKYATKKSWTKNINFITDNSLVTDGTDYSHLISSLNQLNITLNVINTQQITNNVFLTNLVSELYSATTTTLKDTLQNTHRPMINISKSSQMYNTINFADKVTLKVKYSKAVGKSTRLPLKTLQSNTSETSKISSTQIHKLDGNQIKYENIIRAYHYGLILVPSPSESEGGFVKFESPAGLQFLCSYPSHTFRRDWIVGEPAYIHADQKDLPSQQALSSIIHALHRNNLIVLVRYARKENEKPYLGLCVPVIEGAHEYLQFLRIPFADQLRNYSFPSLEREGKRGKSKHLPSDEQCAAMDKFVESMDLGVQEGEDNKDVWFDIHKSYSPATHRIHQAVVHSAALGRIDMNILPPPHPELTKYFNPPDFARKRSRDAAERCKGVFELAEQAPQPKKSRYGNKEEEEQTPLQINIDDLLGSSGGGDAENENEESFTHNTHHNLNNPVQTWQGIDNKVRLSFIATSLHLIRTTNRTTLNTCTKCVGLS